MRGKLGAVVITGLVMGLTACGGATADVSSASSGSAPPPATGSSPTKTQTPAARAMQLIPSSATRIHFVDQRKAFSGLGLEDITGATAKDHAAMDAFTDKARKSGALSELVQYVPIMADWSWNALDVDWEISNQSAGTRPVMIDRIRDGVDMDDVIASFTKHGFTKKSDGDAVRLTRSKKTLKPSQVLPFMFGVTVLPRRHLVVSSGGASTYAVPSENDSFAGKGLVEKLTKDVAEPQRLDVAVGKAACAPTPSRVATIKTITGWSLAMDKPKHATVVAAYDSAKDASADLPARQKLLESGTDHNGGAYADDVTGSARAEGATVRYDLTEQAPASLLAMEVQQDVPWAFCG